MEVLNSLKVHQAPVRIISRERGTQENRKLNVKGKDTTGRICFFYWFFGFYTKLFPSQEVLEIESNLKTVKSLDSFICICSFMHKHNWLS